MVRNFVRRRVILFFVAAALVVCAALGLTMLSAGGVAAHAAESHSTSHPGWTAVPTAGGELTGGNYYLTGDTPLETDLTVTGTVKLCLNGHVLTGTGTSSVITVDGGALTLCDCSTGATNTVAGVEYEGGVLTGGVGTTIGGPTCMVAAFSSGTAAYLRWRAARSRAILRPMVAASMRASRRR